MADTLDRSDPAHAKADDVSAPSATQPTSDPPDAEVSTQPSDLPTSPPKVSEHALDVTGECIVVHGDDLLNKFRSAMNVLLEEKLSALSSSVKVVHEELTSVKQTLDNRITLVDMKLNKATHDMQSLTTQLDNAKAQVNSNTETHRKVQDTFLIHDVTIRNMNSTIQEVRQTSDTTASSLRKVSGKLTETGR